MKTIYLTKTEIGEYILSDTEPALVEVWKDGEGKTGETYYDPFKGWYSEADCDICKVLGVGSMDCDTYTTIDIQ